jgi:hypothetical protein
MGQVMMGVHCVLVRRVSYCPFDFPSSLLNIARISDVGDHGPGNRADSVS